ncbi:MAG: carboxypeptidase regulatory-like domain-containing protein [Candidatus Hydrogenedentes bacterium]|nr:carboxypeptidase regulatory-like domain-containing protein [Candidatus Hydrogenedentota bacterium]
MRNKKMFAFLMGVAILVLAHGCKPVVVLSVKTLDFGTAETQKTFQVWNKTAPTQMNFEITKTASWLTVSPTTGSSKGPSEKVTITVTVSRSGLQPGSYSDTIKVKSPQDGEELVSVSMTVSGGQEGEQEGTAEGTQEGTAEGSQEGTPEGVQEGEPEGQPETNITITGWVNDTNLNPVAYALIELVNTSFKVYTDQTGLYIMENIPKGNYVLSATKEGYAPYSIEVTVGDILPVTVNIILVKQIKVQEVPDIENGAVVTDPDGNGIVIPPNSVFDEAGNPVTGPVDVYITPLDFNEPNDILAFPGGFQGISTSKQGERVDLESYALADFTLKQGDKEVKLDTTAKADNPAEITLDLPDDSPLNAGDKVPLWYFDEELGVWIESGEGTVYDDNGDKYYKAPVQHLTWWNCDAPITDKTCIQGYVKDKQGKPVVGAVVKAIGYSYNGVTTTYTDITGFFCVDVKGNSTVIIEIYLPGSQIPVYQQTINANTVGNSCQTGICINLGTITGDFNSCIQGTVTDSNGNPLGNVTVRSSAGTEAITDSSGHYCLEAVGDVPITVYVVTRPPVTVLAKANTSCSAGDCVVADIKVEYPKDGSYVGIMSVTSNKQQAYKATQYLISSTAVFASFPQNPITGPNDQCSVQTFKYKLSEGGPQQDDLPQINWSGLDPGAPGSFQCSNQSVDFIRMSDSYIQETGMIQPWMYSIFILDYTKPIYTIEETPAFTASWPGGFDIGAFSLNGQIPPQLVITSPQIRQTTSGPIFAFDPTQDMNLVWNVPPTPVPGSFIEVDLSGVTYTFEGQSEVINLTVITCILTDDGSHVIPKELLQQLPTGTPIKPVVITLTVTRCHVKEVSVPLVKGGNGKLVVSAQTMVNAYSLQNIPTP